MDITAVSLPLSTSMTRENLKKLNKEQFDLSKILYSQGKQSEANAMERIASITNRNLILGHSTFDIPQINQTREPIKVHLIEPGLLGGDSYSKITIRNYTNHKINFKSSHAQSGYFKSSPSEAIPSSGLAKNAPVTMEIERSAGKFFLNFLGVGIPTVVGSEAQAASISLSVETKNYSYTVVLGILEYEAFYINRAGVEIRGGELRLGKDRDTCHGVDVSGVVSCINELCRQRHCGPSSDNHTFYEDAKSSNPEEGFTVKCFFKNGTNENFNFEFHPLSSDGMGYRG